MCEEVSTKWNGPLAKYFSFNMLLGWATALGLLSGYLNIEAINAVASAISGIFINLLKLVSLPIIFLSIVSTACSMSGMGEIRVLGTKVAKYTFLTTIIAATIALCLYLLLDPVNGQVVANAAAAVTETASQQNGYFHYLVQTIPSNIVQPFVENNVIGVLIIAMGLSFAILTLPNESRTVLHSFFSSLYGAVMKITSWIVQLMPIAIWGFITLFIRDLQGGLEAKSIALYLTVVVLANVIQAIVVLPALLKSKGISPIATFKGMFPALSVAFFSKSSSGALPMAMKCAEENVGVSRKVASFSLPLCTTINMNGCAAFILTTVLFVSMSNGMTYSGVEMVAWIFIATIAAIGNAGVPMGCYFLASAFLAAMNVPLNILGIILPFYTLIDMLESAINVWSDSCVAVIVEKEVNPVPAIQPAVVAETEA